MSKAIQNHEHFRTDHLMADLKGRSVRGGAVTMVAQGAKFALQLTSTAILARLLTPADFGLVAMVTAVTGLVAMFKDAGLSMATVQRDSITHAQVSNLFWLNVALSTSLMVLTASLAPAIAWFYGEPRLTAISFAIAATFILSGLAVQHQALLQRQMRFTALATIQVLSMGGGVTIGILIGIQTSSYWALVAMQITNAAVYTAGTWIASGWIPGRPRRRSGIRPMLRFGGGLTIANMFHQLCGSADTVLIGRFLGSDSVGLYSKAFGLLLLPTRQMLTPLGNVVLPVLSRLSGDRSRFRSTALDVLRLVAMMSLPTVAMLVVLGDWLVLVVLGPEWVEASGIFRILTLSAMLQPLNGVLSWILTSLGKTREIVRWATVNGVLTAASIALGLPWGLTGVAISYTLVGILIRTPHFYWIVSSVSPLTLGDFWRCVYPYMAISLLIVVVLALSRMWIRDLNPFLGLPILLVLGMACYLLLLLILPERRKDLRKLFNLRKALKK